MRYVSIDLETTGLDENEHQIIEFGAIIEDSKNLKSYEDSPKYNRIVLARDRKYVFSSVAAAMNADLIKLISQLESGVNIQFYNYENLSTTKLFLDELIPDFKLWLLANGFKENSRGNVEIVAAGKNFGSFDRRFLQAIPDFESYGVRFHHRSIDPVTSYIDWDDDNTPPSTDQCKIRAAIEGNVKHEALADAWDVIQLLRLQYNKNIDLRSKEIKNLNF